LARSAEVESRSYEVETRLQIRYKKILEFDVFKGYHGGNNNALEEAKTYSGLVTEGAIKRVRRAVDILLQISKGRMIHNPMLDQKVYFKVGFLTLTFHVPEGLFVPEGWKMPTVKEGNIMLGEFLDRMKRINEIKDYVWKAEYTKQIGLHYHVTINNWIDCKLIRNEWNKVLDKYGWLESFKAMYGHSDMNSTDIHSVGKIRSIGGYIASYMSKPMKKKKGQTDQQFEKEKDLYEAKIKAIGGQGKIWGCSNNLKGCNYYHIPYNEQTKKILKYSRVSGTDTCNIYEASLDNNDRDYNNWKKSIKELA